MEFCRWKSEVGWNHEIDEVDHSLFKLVTYEYTHTRIPCTYHICSKPKAIPLILQSFLQNRTFKVKVVNHHSTSHRQDNGILQGSPLSGILFMIAINEITNLIHSPFNWILFVDDLSIHLRSSNSQRAHPILQNAVNLTQDWLWPHGSRISSTKTNLLTKNNRPPPSLPPLYLNGNAIPLVDMIKFLGRIFHLRHSWLPRNIRFIKARCLRALNVLKMLSHPIRGCNQRVLLPLYQSLVRSILNYGSPIYDVAPTSHLELLDPVQNSAIRIATGAFRTSPAINQSLRPCWHPSPPISQTNPHGKTPHRYPPTSWHTHLW